MTDNHEDEIDLFELFEAIWDGRWIVSAAMLMTTLAGCVFLIFHEAAYESKLNFSVNTIPPFYDDERALADFRKRFYSKREFENWKKSNSGTSLLFENVSATHVVDGYIVSKNKNELFVDFVDQKGGSSAVLMRTNQLSILDDFFRYSNHINDVLKNDYVLRATDELKMIESRFNELGLLDITNAEILLSINRFILSAEKGDKVIIIQRPTKPISTSLSPLLVLSISVVLGGMIGGFWIFVCAVISKRRQQLAKM